MIRLTDDRTAECLRANNEKLREAGYEVDPASERYVRLADYERIAQTPEELREYIGKLAERRDNNPEKNRIERYSGLRDAARKVKGYASNISRAISSHKKYKGYIWEIQKEVV